MGGGGEGGGTRGGVKGYEGGGGGGGREGIHSVCISLHVPIEANVTVNIQTGDSC